MAEGSGVRSVTLDMNAAFDLVDYDLLVQKLALFGFDSDSVAWVRSYLKLRNQNVMIEGCLSNLSKLTEECSRDPFWAHCSLLSLQMNYLK